MIATIWKIEKVVSGSTSVARQLAEVQINDPKQVRGLAEEYGGDVVTIRPMDPEDFDLKEILDERLRQLNDWSGQDTLGR